MKHTRYLIFVSLIILSWLLSSCTKAPAAHERIQPVKLEKLEDQDLNRVIITERAAERLGIQTALVSEQVVARTWSAGGEVVMPRKASATITAPAKGTVFAAVETANPYSGMRLMAGQPVLHLYPANPSDESREVVSVQAPGDSFLLRILVTPGQVVEAGQALFEVVDMDEAWVRVPLNENDIGLVDRGLPARISSLDADDEEDTDEDELEADSLTDIEEDEKPTELLYTMSNTGHSMALGQRVLVELTLSGSGATRLVIPYSAVLYDLQGNTWVYVNPEPLVFIRQPVTVDYVQDDLAVLLEGPPSGTSVVTVGVAELYGADTGVGK